MLAAHLDGEHVQFGGDLVLVAGLNECHFATAAEHAPHHLPATDRLTTSPTGNRQTYHIIYQQPTDLPRHLPVTDRLTTSYTSNQQTYHVIYR